MGEEQTELDKIVLEEVTPEEFRSMQEFWKTNLSIREDNIYSRVINPLRFDAGDNGVECYYRFICYLLEKKRIARISVRNDKYWINVYKKRCIDPSKLQKIAEIASQDPIKRNHLKLQLPTKAGKVGVPTIEFVEYAGQIIGYEVGVPFQYRNRFNIVTKREVYGWNNGLWVPENYKDLQSPASLRGMLNQ